MEPRPKTLPYLREKDEDSRTTTFEQGVIAALVSLFSNIPGDIAEVGVFKGHSARVICEYKKNKNLYLFDNFEGGIPEQKWNEIDAIGTQPESLDSMLADVERFLEKYPGVRFIKGVFPESAREEKELRENEYSFVHLDCDLYQTTLDALNFFYPRIKKGIILIHDYPALDGVKKAVDEFIEKNPRLTLIQFTELQAGIIL